MEGIIKVDPSRLISASEEFNGTGGQIRSLTDQMVAIVDSLNGVWEGEAANAFNQKFHQLDDDIARIHKMIQEHVKDLQDMAQQYMTAESANLDTGNSLAGDIIS